IIASGRRDPDGCRGVQRVFDATRFVFDLGRFGLRGLLAATPAGLRAFMPRQPLPETAQEAGAFPQGGTKIVADERIGALPSADPADRLREKVRQIAEPVSDSAAAEV